MGEMPGKDNNHNYEGLVSRVVFNVSVELDSLKGIIFKLNDVEAKVRGHVYVN